MTGLSSEILKYLSSHAPATLKKISENTGFEAIYVFGVLCELFEKGLIKKLDFSIEGNLDPDFCRKYTVKR